MSIEDINYMKENSIKQAYTFIIDSSERDRNLYPNPNNYVVNFSTPFKNIIGMEIIDASIPRAMYTIDVDNNEFYYYIGNDGNIVSGGDGTGDYVGDAIIENGIQIQNDANLMLRNWNYTSNVLSVSSNIFDTSNIVRTSNIAIANNSNIAVFDIFKIINSSNLLNSSNVINNSNLFSTSNLFGNTQQFNTSNLYTMTSNLLTERTIFTTSNITITSNIFNFATITNVSRSSNISSSGNGGGLELSGDRYGILDNSINIYNIYNNTANANGNGGTSIGSIGGNTEGITFNLSIQALIGDTNINKEYNVIDFSYNHTYSIETDIIFRNISVDVAKSSNNLYVLSFTIGERKESVFNIAMNGYINVFWSILKTTWYVGIFDATLNTQIAYKEFLNCDELYNVFFTKKYIGRKHTTATVANPLATTGWENNLLRLKDFKIYNIPMKNATTMATMNAMTPSTMATNTFLGIPVWYKMDEVVQTATAETAILNKGSHATIRYEDVFKKIVISPGDYTFRTFISKYDELIKNNDIEIMFNETSTPPELTNLIDIYSKAPMIVDMKRTTLSENLGFDLYPTANQADRYNSKPYTTTESVLAKMFYSRTNVNYNADVSVNDKYIITSPGIVYFIGNKYIIMRCPEIEEHLYRSLSYSKNTLGIAKIRVDSVGINSEKLTITKLPVREFHPIGKLSRMSFRFETSKGGLYDFKGLNHNIIFAIFYYEPIQKNIPKNSILNPEYKMNYLDYLYKQEEIEGDSDDGNADGEDFSRDNIDDYKIKENMYSERGVQLQQSNTYYQNNNITDVIMENEDVEGDVEDTESDDEGDDDTEGDEYN